MRLYFATDIHGSETCWRKFLNAGKHYNADVIVLGGDMTGKALVPVINDGGGRWHATLLENRSELTTEDEVLAFEDAVIRRGYYPFRTTPDEVRELAADEPRWHALFEEHMLKTVERWMTLADEKLHDKGIACFVCPGNDDQLEVDEVVANAKTVELGEGRVIDVNGFQLASSGWANRTPWDTYREEDEDVLLERFERMIKDVTTDPEHTIFSLHCPPHNTVIERYQPALALHGHIHEARGTHRLGKTLCINPGSSYEQGQLLGAVIDIEGKKKVKNFVLTSG
jgi:uncharacterized protein